MVRSGVREKGSSLSVALRVASGEGRRGKMAATAERRSRWYFAEVWERKVVFCLLHCAARARESMYKQGTVRDWVCVCLASSILTALFHCISEWKKLFSLGFNAQNEWNFRFQGKEFFRKTFYWNKYVV